MKLQPLPALAARQASVALPCGSSSQVASSFFGLALIPEFLGFPSSTTDAQPPPPPKTRPLATGPHAASSLCDPDLLGSFKSALPLSCRRRRRRPHGRPQFAPPDASAGPSLCSQAGGIHGIWTTMHQLNHRRKSGLALGERTQGWCQCGCSAIQRSLVVATDS